MLKIRGTTVAEPASVTITQEPVWASNTGRLQDGTMDGDIVGWKRTVEVSWAVLDFAQTKTIIDAIKGNGHSGFFSIQFTKDLVSGNPTPTVDPTDANDLDSAITVYSSNIPRTVYSLTSAHQFHTGVTVTFIEK